MSGDHRRLELELRGRSFEIFLYLLRKGSPAGVREVQRALGLSSPSVAFHHLEKLHSLGVVRKDESGSYQVVDNVDISLLQAFVKVGRLLLPRMIFYAAFFTTFTVLYLSLEYSRLDIFALTLGLAASAFTWFETLRAWRRRPW
ncbi:MAG: helix-turn-helix domain-containing protein [Nitrososphaerota archaeon]